MLTNGSSRLKETVVNHDPNEIDDVCGIFSQDVKEIFVPET